MESIEKFAAKFEIFMESIEKFAAKFCIGILEMKLDL